MPSAKPIIFTLSGSTRHEVLQLPTVSTTITSSSQKLHTALQTQILHAVAVSPNCAEVMAQFKTVQEGATETVKEIHVRWAHAGRDATIWPKTTVVTEENCEAVIGLMDHEKDVLEVTLS